MKSDKATKILAVLLLAIVFGYLAIGIYRSSGNIYKTSTAYVQSVSETIDARMYVIREEHIITSDVSGVVVSLAKSGGKVSSGSNIAAIFKREKDAENYAKALSLEKKLDTYRRIDSQAKLVNSDMKKLTDETNRNFYLMLDSVYYNKFSALTENQLTFSENVSRRSISLGYEIDCTDKIVSLEKEITKLKSVQPSKVIKTDYAGYYVSRPDGFERVLTNEKIDELTPEMLEKAFESDKRKVPKNSMGKVINGFEWYAACIVPADRLTGVEVGKKIRLMFGESENETVDSRLYSKKMLDDGGCLAVFKCSFMNEELSNLRKVSGKIIIRDYTGIKIRKDAVRFNDKNQPGVYIKEGNLIKFNRIEEIYSDENFVIAENKAGAAGWLAQYDEIVVSGKELSDGKVVE